MFGCDFTFKEYRKGMEFLLNLFVTQIASPLLLFYRTCEFPTKILKTFTLKKIQAANVSIFLNF
jgi:hypothetical protein